MNFTVNLLDETNDLICSNNDEKLRKLVEHLKNILVKIYHLAFHRNFKSLVRDRKWSKFSKPKILAESENFWPTIASKIARSCCLLVHLQLHSIAFVTKSWLTIFYEDEILVKKWIRPNVFCTSISYSKKLLSTKK